MSRSRADNRVGTGRPKRQTVRRCAPVPPHLRRTAQLLERRWQILIIYAALSGAARFSDYVAAVEGISPRVLSERLRELERAGLLERSVLPSSPPAVEYRLTAEGRRLAPIIKALLEYSSQPAS
jgi:DNA-binding HxlR family transcriptional regulator